MQTPKDRDETEQIQAWQQVVGSMLTTNTLKISKRQYTTSNYACKRLTNHNENTDNKHEYTTELACHIWVLANLETQNSDQQKYKTKHWSLATKIAK